jgi:flagellar basal-body rod modification protein FlgD
MSELSISGIRTSADLRAEAATPVEEELDRNAFLKLFTAQLENQNPLDPMKNEAFVAQLAQFSTLEATEKMSDSMDQFVSSQSGEQIMRGASLIGRSVFVNGATITQGGGQVKSGFANLTDTADELTLSVIDAKTGQVVNSMDLGPQLAGEVSFAWNGGNFAGEAAPEGEYFFSAQARKGDDTRVVPVLGETKVKAVSYNDFGQVLVEISDGQTMALSEVTRISE